jgi:hypothetical protein
MRWIISIENNQLNVRNSGSIFDLTEYHGNRLLIGLAMGNAYLGPDEAADEEPFAPVPGDWRVSAFRQIKERRGQQKFRNILRERYGESCMVSGCCLMDVIEAAHIAPYRGEKDNHPANGILLRADLHTLFDLDLLGNTTAHVNNKTSPGRDSGGLRRVRRRDTALFPEAT